MDTIVIFAAYYLMGYFAGYHLTIAIYEWRQYKRNKR